MLSSQCYERYSDRVFKLRHHLIYFHQAVVMEINLSRAGLQLIKKKKTDIFTLHSLTQYLRVALQSMIQETALY